MFQYQPKLYYKQHDEGQQNWSSALRHDRCESRKTMRYKLLDTNKVQGLLAKNAVQVPYLQIGNNIQKVPKYRLPGSPWRVYTNKEMPCAKNTSC